VLCLCAWSVCSVVLCLVICLCFFCCSFFFFFSFFCFVSFLTHETAGALFPDRCLIHRRCGAPPLVVGGIFLSFFFFGGMFFFDCAPLFLLFCFVFFVSCLSPARDCFLFLFDYTQSCFFFLLSFVDLVFLSFMDLVFWCGWRSFIKNTVPSAPCGCSWGRSKRHACIRAESDAAAKKKKKRMRLSVITTKTTLSVYPALLCRRRNAFADRCISPQKFCCLFLMCVCVCHCQSCVRAACSSLRRLIVAQYSF
jgi:hypothetical protein